MQTSDQIKIPTDSSVTYTTIHDAVEAGNLLEVVRLLDAGANINVGIVNDPYRYGETPLHTAALHGKTEIAEVLIKHGAVVNKPDYCERTPLYCAADASQEYEDLVELLLNNGAKAVIDIGEPVHEGTPLGSAMGNFHQKVARLLIIHGADVNLGDDNGYTPLHAACTGGLTDMVNLLIEYGANVNVIGTGNYTPLQAAACMGKKDIMAILIQHGADQTVVNWTGKTAADMLAEHNKTQEYLKNRAQNKLQVISNINSLK